MIKLTYSLIIMEDNIDQKNRFDQTTIIKNLPKEKTIAEIE